MGKEALQKRIKKLTDYMKKVEKTEERAESVPREHTTPHRVEQEPMDIVSELLEVATKRFEQPKVKVDKGAITPEQPSKPQVQPPGEYVERRLQELATLLAEDAFKRLDVKIVTCDKQGKCTDDKRIGETFKDDRGIEWQRGFIVTTRLPIFLDFIVENATVTGRVGKALVVETSRGAKALIPEDYICEVASRYGVKVQLDKCMDYKTSPWAEKTKSKKK